MICKKKLTKPKMSTITSKVLSHLSIYYFSVAIILTFIQVLFEYNNIKKSVNEYVSDIHLSFTDSLTNSIWEFNQTQTESIVEGISKSPTITSVKVIAPDDNVIFEVEDTHTKKIFLERIFPRRIFEYKKELIKEIDINEKESIGSLLIYSDNLIILNQLSHLITYIFFSSIVKTMILWIILLYFFNNRLRLPLQELTDQLMTINPKKPYKLETSRNNDISEFNQIHSAFNQLIEQINDYRDVLEAIVENKTEELEVKSNEINELINKLKSAQEKIIRQEKVASLGVLSAGIAHELKNPLNLIINSNQIINDLVTDLDTQQEKKEDVLKVSKIMQESANRMNSILKNMLLQSPSTNETREMMNVYSLIETNFNILIKSNSSYFNLKVGFNNNIPKDLKIPIFVNDFGRLLLNLFENSLYALKSKVNLCDYKPVLSISCTQTREFVKFQVHDNGIGIKKENIGKIFEPFVTSKPFGLGTGLGMHLVYDIVKKHDGEIRIDSKDGDYTTIEFSIKVN